MDPGDLVQFDLRQERHMRFASNPRLVAEDQYPTLAQELTMVDADADSFGGPNNPPLIERETISTDAKIIPFDIAKRDALRAHNTLQKAV